MSSRTATRLIGAFAVPAIALGLTACGSDEKPSSEGATSADEGAAAALSPQDAILASVANLDDSSYKMESGMTVDGVDFMAMTGMYDSGNSQASADIFMGAMMEASGEEMPPEMEAMMGDMHTETIAIDQVMYMQMSGGMFDALAETYGEDAWFTMDLTSDDAMAEAYAQYAGMDLGQQTELILTELTDVEETGDGVYTGTLSADSEAMSALSGAAMGMGSDAAEATGMVEGTEVTVTLDGDGLLKSMAMTMPEIEGMVMEMTSEIVEIGGSYDIKAPESTNLHDFSELAAGLGGM